MFGSISAAVVLADPAEDYREFCTVCHGEYGDGKSQAAGSLTSPPLDFTRPRLPETLSPQAMIDVVSNGKQGTAMVAWGTRLGSERVEALVDYIRTSFMVREEPAATPAMNHPAHQLYLDTCAVCHGEDGGGSEWAENSLNKAPRNFLSAESASDLSPERIHFSITNGRAGTAMVGFSGRLGEYQIESLADYVWSELMHNVRDDAPAVPAIDVDQSALMPGGLRGDPLAGRNAYATHCVACHGPGGAGDGPRSHFIEPPPRSFTAEESMQVFNRPGLFYGTKFGVEGKPMPAWASLLSDQEIADIAEFMFREFIQQEESPP